MINVNIDLSQIVKLGDLKEAADKAIKDAARDLTIAAHAKMLEIANSKLHSRRQLFVDNLSYHQVSDDTWIIELDVKARWIDDGTPERDMLDDLLKSPKAKTARDGSKYITIPFGHGPGKGTTNTTPAQQDLISTLKSEMKSKGIPFAGIEKNAEGQAKIGKLHSFDIMKKPLKTAHQAGQGWGPIGDVKQGPNERQAAGGGGRGGGIPFLQGVSVYQTPDPKAKSGAKRSIMTFRIASSKHRGQGRWEHPGNEATSILETAAEWALGEWDKIAPGIVEKINASIT